jgi:hypothetical protein
MVLAAGVLERNHDNELKLGDNEVMAIKKSAAKKNAIGTHGAGGGRPLKTAKKAVKKAVKKAAKKKA